MQAKVACYVGTQLMTGLVTLSQVRKHQRVSDLLNDGIRGAVILDQGVVRNLLARNEPPESLGTVRLLKSQIHLMVPLDTPKPPALRPAYVSKELVSTRLGCGPYEVSGILHYNSQDKLDVQTLFGEKNFDAFVPLTDATLRFLLCPGWEASVATLLVNRDAVSWASLETV